MPTAPRCGQGMRVVGLAESERRFRIAGFRRPPVNRTSRREVAAFDKAPAARHKGRQFTGGELRSGRHGVTGGSARSVAPPPARSRRRSAPAAVPAPAAGDGAGAQRFGRSKPPRPPSRRPAPAPFRTHAEFRLPGRPEARSLGGRRERRLDGGDRGVDAFEPLVLAVLAALPPAAWRRSRRTAQARPGNADDGAEAHQHLCRGTGTLGLRPLACGENICAI